MGKLRVHLATNLKVGKNWYIVSLGNAYILYIWENLVDKNTIVHYVFKLKSIFNYE